MPVYEYKGQFYDLAETDPAAAKAKIQASLSGTTAKLPAQTGTAAPESMIADPSNPFSFLGQEQQTEQGPAMQAVSQGVQRGLQVGAGLAKGAVINPVAAVAQVAGGETGRQFAQEAQKAYETQRANAGATGFDFAELGGALASPVNLLIPGGAGGRAALGGAAGAALTPVVGENLSMSDVLAGKVEQMGLGAVAGRLVSGLAGALTPTLKTGVRELMDKGIPVSPGQAYEGIPGLLYRQIEKLDLPGMRVNKEAVNLAFTKATGDDVLGIVGEKLPANVTNGQQIFGIIQNKLTNFYDNALEKIGTVTRDAEFNNALKGVQTQVAETLGDRKLSTGFKNFITANIDRRAKDGTLTGKDLKSLEEIFRKKIDSIKATDTPAEVLKAGYDDAYKAIKGLILRNDTNGDITKANLAYMQRSRIMEATQKNATEIGAAGTYSPAELAKVAAKQGSDIEAARGTAPLQAEATQTLNVVGDTTQEAAKFRTLMIAGKLSGLGALGFFSPMIALPILTASGVSYAAAKALMKDPGAARQAVSKALSENPALFGVVPANVREQLKAMKE